MIEVEGKARISDIGLVKACENAVYGMLPVNKLRNTWMKQLHIYESDEHPHKANLGQRRPNAMRPVAEK